MSNVTPLHEQAGAPPPHNAEIEAALLGALLTNDRAYDRVADILLPEHFYEPVHGRIYEAIARLMESGKAAGPQTLARHFDADEGLTEAGGGQYLYELAAGVISVVNVKQYAEQIRDLATLRGLIEVGQNIAGMAERTGLDDKPDGIAEFAYGQLDDLMRAPNESRVETLHAAGARALAMHEAAWKNKGEVTGVPTGFIDLDRKTAGLHPGNLIIIAGRPSMGKSALAFNIATRAARSGRRGMFFSLEMSAEELATREQASLAGIPSERIRRGELDDAEFRALIAAQEELREIPLTVDADSALTVSALRSRVRRAKRKAGVDLVIVDYLQLMRSSAEARRYGNKVQEISEITRGLKQLAGEMKVPVIALSQLSRQVEQREDKRPTLADLRESGSIEQDADVVMFVYREAYYVEKAEPMKKTGEAQEAFDIRFADWAEHMSRVRNMADLYVAKQRQGPVGKVSLYFDGPLMRFGNLDKSRQEAMEL